MNLEFLQLWEICLFWLQSSPFKRKWRYTSQKKYRVPCLRLNWNKCPTKLSKVPCIGDEFSSLQMYPSQRGSSLNALIFPAYPIITLMVYHIIASLVKRCSCSVTTFYWLRERISNLHLNEIEQRVIKASIKRPPVFVNSFLIGTVNIFSWCTFCCKISTFFYSLSPVSDTPH